MYKKTIIIFTLVISATAFSQTGIKTSNPNPSADLDLGSTNKTLFLNRVANPTTDIANPQLGMMLYDTTMKCVRVYQSDPPAWSDCLKGTSSTLKITQKKDFSQTKKDNVQTVMPTRQPIKRD